MENVYVVFSLPSKNFQLNWMWCVCVEKKSFEKLFGKLNVQALSHTHTPTPWPIATQISEFHFIIFITLKCNKNINSEYTWNLETLDI